MFKDGRVYAQNRFVSTDIWDPDAPEGEGAAGAARAWTSRPGGWRKNVFKLPGNPVNTSVMVKGGKLYALCEGGKPVEMDPVTLETLGVSDLGGIQVRPGGWVRDRHQRPCTPFNLVGGGRLGYNRSERCWEVRTERGQVL